MTTAYDVLHEAAGVVSVAVDTPGDYLPMAAAAATAAKTLGTGEIDDWRGWHALAMGLVDLSVAILASAAEEHDVDPSATLESILRRFPR